MTAPELPAAHRAVLAAALPRAGLGADADRAVAVRIGENAIVRLPGEVVARIARPGQQQAAAREITIARYLAEHGVPAVRALDIAQPVVVGERAVTFWRRLPPHTPGTVRDVAHLVRALHRLPLPPPESGVGRLDPFVRLEERIAAATSLAPTDRGWLAGRLAELRTGWEELPAGLDERLVHGDAWVGNVARFADGTSLLMDLERCSVGPPEWDLVSTAIKTTSFGWVAPAEYDGFVEVYGYDVTGWSGFPLLRDVRELRMCLYFAQHAPGNRAMHDEALLRLRCLQGELGPRPWPWTPAT
ncbi:aminoglycoside phosphotransferase family protein [Marinactinospora endophytica]